MKLLGIQRKSDGEIVLVTHFGQSYKLPDGLKIPDINLVTIFVPENQSEGRLLTPEEIEEMKKHREEAEKQQKELEDFAKDNKIGLGDLVYLFTHSTGFKKYWDEYHGGECAPCQERQASWNYFKFKGPEFLKKMVEKAKGEGKKSA